MFLYETLDGLRRREAPPLPAWIRENLNPRLPLRPYQEAAFQNFSLYWERLRRRDRPCQLLFHMATGSGKTLVMAGLMADLYRRGYRNFLFFVNLTAIVRKTRENFLNPRSAKYLFAPELRVDGRRVLVREVSGFSAGDPDAINLLFTTTQALHAELWQVRENGLSPAELAAAPVVLISDEAHHLNAATKRAGRAEADSRRSWEETVERVFLARPDNVLLEFTATCDLHNPQILETYRDKIVYSYPLRTFRAEGYSKEILTLRTDLRGPPVHPGHAAQPVPAEALPVPPSGGKAGGAVQVRRHPGERGLPGGLCVADGDAVRPGSGPGRRPGPLPRSGAGPDLPSSCSSTPWRTRRTPTGRCLR